jgi:ABC-2 type transport system ATP-binding protein
LTRKGHPVNILSDNFIELNDLEAINHPDEIGRLLVQAGIPPMQLIKEEEELERYFLRLVGMNGETK